MNEDHTRRILNLIRENKDKEITKLLKEQGELAPIDEMLPTDEFETADTEEFDEDSGKDREIDDAELKEEEDKFRQTVHNRVKFNKFKLYPSSQNVEWGGKFTDSRIEWNYSLDDTRGVYISAELLQLRDETLEVIKKLVGYYKAWSDDWANRVADEYDKSPDDEEETEVAFEPGDDLPDEV